MKTTLHIKNMVTTDNKFVVPVYVKGFTDIGAFNITITYDAEVMLLTDPPKSLTSGKGTLGFNNNTLGQIKFGWFTWPGVTLPDGSVLFELGFTKVKDGVSPISFITDFGISNDKWETLETDYINGTVTLKQKDIMARITLVYTNITTTLKAGQIIDIPISLKDETPTTAISLCLKYPDELISIVGMTSDIVEGDCRYGLSGVNDMRIGWYHLNPIKTFEIKIKCRVKVDTPIGQQIKFVIYEVDPLNPLSELAGADYNPIEGVELYTTALAQKSTIAARKAAQGYISNPVQKTCANCKNYDGVKRCTKGDFVVAKKGLCDLHL